MGDGQHGLCPAAMLMASGVVQPEAMMVIRICIHDPDQDAASCLITRWLQLMMPRWTL